MCTLRGTKITVIRDDGTHGICLRPNTSNITIGSSIVCDVRIKNEQTRKIHCTIYADTQNNIIKIKNLSKKNPLHLNGVPVKNTHVLNNGDVISILARKFLWTAVSLKKSKRLSSGKNYLESNQNTDRQEDSIQKVKSEDGHSSPLEETETLTKLNTNRAKHITRRITCKINKIPISKRLKAQKRITIYDFRNSGKNVNSTLDEDEEIFEEDPNESECKMENSAIPTITISEHDDSQSIIEEKDVENEHTIVSRSMVKSNNTTPLKDITKLQDKNIITTPKQQYTMFPLEASTPFQQLENKNLNIVKLSQLEKSDSLVWSVSPATVSYRGISKSFACDAKNISIVNELIEVDTPENTVVKKTISSSMYLIDLTTPDASNLSTLQPRTPNKSIIKSTTLLKSALKNSSNISKTPKSTLHTTANSTIQKVDRSVMVKKVLNMTNTIDGSKEMEKGKSLRNLNKSMSSHPTKLVEPAKNVNLSKRKTVSSFVSSKCHDKTKEMQNKSNFLTFSGTPHLSLRKSLACTTPAKTPVKGRVVTPSRNNFNHTNVKNVGTINTYIQSAPIQVVDISDSSIKLSPSKEDSAPCDDLSGSKLIISPEKQIMTEDVTEVGDVKELMNVPANDDLQESQTVEELMKTPINDIPNNDSTDVTGVQKAINNPAHDDLRDERGVKELMGTPGKYIPVNDLTDVTGVKGLMNTPVHDDLRGVKELMRTPGKHIPVNDLTDVAGVKELMNTPAHDDLRDVRGVKDLFNTPHEGHNPDFTVNFDTFTNMINSSYDLENGSKNVSICTLPSVDIAPDTTFNNESEDAIDEDDDSEFKEDCVSKIASSDEIKTMDDTFNELIGKKSVTKTYSRSKSTTPLKQNNLTPFQTEKIEKWVESVAHVGMDEIQPKPNNNQQILSNRYSNVTPQASIVELLEHNCEEDDACDDESDKQSSVDSKAESRFEKTAIIDPVDRDVSFKFQNYDLSYTSDSENSDVNSDQTDVQNESALLYEENDDIIPSKQTDKTVKCLIETQLEMDVSKRNNHQEMTDIEEECILLNEDIGDIIPNTQQEETPKRLSRIQHSSSVSLQKRIHKPALAISILENKISPLITEDITTSTAQHQTPRRLTRSQLESNISNQNNDENDSRDTFVIEDDEIPETQIEVFQGDMVDNVDELGFEMSSQALETNISLVLNGEEEIMRELVDNDEDDSRDTYIVETQISQDQNNRSNDSSILFIDDTIFIDKSKIDVATNKSDNEDNSSLIICDDDSVTGGASSIHRTRSKSETPKKIDRQTLKTCRKTMGGFNDNLPKLSKFQQEVLKCPPVELIDKTIATIDLSESLNKSIELNASESFNKLNESDDLNEVDEFDSKLKPEISGVEPLQNLESSSCELIYENSDDEIIDSVFNHLKKDISNNTSGVEVKFGSSQLDKKSPETDHEVIENFDESETVQSVRGASLSLEQVSNFNKMSRKTFGGRQENDVLENTRKFDVENKSVSQIMVIECSEINSKVFEKNEDNKIFRTAGTVIPSSQKETIKQKDSRKTSDNLLENDNLINSIILDEENKSASQQMFEECLELDSDVFENFDENEIVRSNRGASLTPESIAKINKLSRKTVGDRTDIKICNSKFGEEINDINLSVGDIDSNPTLGRRRAMSTDRKAKSPVTTTHNKTICEINFEEPVDECLELDSDVFEHFDENETVRPNRGASLTPKSIAKINKLSRKTVGDRTDIKICNSKFGEQINDINLSVGDIDSNPTLGRRRAMSTDRKAKSPVTTTHNKTICEINFEEPVDECLELDSDVFENFDENEIVRSNRGASLTPKSIAKINKLSRKTVGDRTDIKICNSKFGEEINDINLSVGDIDSNPTLGRRRAMSTDRKAKSPVITTHNKTICEINSEEPADVLSDVNKLKHSNVTEDDSFIVESLSTEVASIVNKTIISLDNTLEEINVNSENDGTVLRVTCNTSETMKTGNGNENLAGPYTNDNSPHKSLQTINSKLTDVFDLSDNNESSNVNDASSCVLIYADSEDEMIDSVFDNLENDSTANAKELEPKTQSASQTIGDEMHSEVLDNFNDNQEGENVGDKSLTDTKDVKLNSSTYPQTTEEDELNRQGIAKSKFELEVDNISLSVGDIDQGAISSRRRAFSIDNKTKSIPQNVQNKTISEINCEDNINSELPINPKLESPVENVENSNEPPSPVIEICVTKTISDIPPIVADKTDEKLEPEESGNLFNDEESDMIVPETQEISGSALSTRNSESIFIIPETQPFPDDESIHEIEISQSPKSIQNKSMQLHKLSLNSPSRTKSPKHTKSQSPSSNEPSEKVENTVIDENVTIIKEIPEFITPATRKRRLYSKEVYTAVFEDSNESVVDFQNHPTSTPFSKTEPNNDILIHNLEVHGLSGETKHVREVEVIVSEAPLVQKSKRIRKIQLFEEEKSSSVKRGRRPGKTDESDLNKEQVEDSAESDQPIAIKDGYELLESNVIPTAPEINLLEKEAVIKNIDAENNKIARRVVFAEKPEEKYFEVISEYEESMKVPDRDRRRPVARSKTGGKNKINDNEIIESDESFEILPVKKIRGRPPVQQEIPPIQTIDSIVEKRPVRGRRKRLASTKKSVEIVELPDEEENLIKVPEPISDKIVEPKSSRVPTKRNGKDENKSDNKKLNTDQKVVIIEELDEIPDENKNVQNIENLKQSDGELVEKKSKRGRKAPAQKKKNVEVEGPLNTDAKIKTNEIEATYFEEEIKNVDEHLDSTNQKAVEPVIQGNRLKALIQNTNKTTSEPYPDVQQEITTNEQSISEKSQKELPEIDVVEKKITNRRKGRKALVQKKNTDEKVIGDKIEMVPVGDYEETGVVAEVNDKNLDTSGDSVFEKKIDNIDKGGKTLTRKKNVKVTSDYSTDSKTETGLSSVEEVKNNENLEKFEVEKKISTRGRGRKVPIQKKNVKKVREHSADDKSGTETLDTVQTLKDVKGSEEHLESSDVEIIEKKTNNRGKGRKVTAQKKKIDKANEPNIDKKIEHVEVSSIVEEVKDSDECVEPTNLELVEQRTDRGKGRVALNKKVVVSESSTSEIVINVSSISSVETSDKLTSKAHRSPVKKNDEITSETMEEVTKLSTEQINLEPIIKRNIRGRGRPASKKQADVTSNDHIEPIDKIIVDQNVKKITEKIEPSDAKSNTPAKTVRGRGRDLAVIETNINLASTNEHNTAKHEDNQHVATGRSRRAVKKPSRYLNETGDSAADTSTNEHKQEKLENSTVGKKLAVKLLKLKVDTPVKSRGQRGTPVKEEKKDETPLKLPTKSKKDISIEKETSTPARGRGRRAKAELDPNTSIESETPVKSRGRRAAAEKNTITTKRLRNDRKIDTSELETNDSLISIIEPLQEPTPISIKSNSGKKDTPTTENIEKPKSSSRLKRKTKEEPSIDEGVSYRLRKRQK